MGKKRRGGGGPSGSPHGGPGMGMGGQNYGGQAQHAGGGMGGDVGPDPAQFTGADSAYARAKLEDITYDFEGPMAIQDRKARAPFGDSFSSLFCARRA